MIHITESASRVDMRFDTWEELERAATKPQLNGGHSHLKSSEHGSNFFHYPTWDEAVQAFKVSGWPEGWAKMRDSMGEIKDSGMKSLRFEPVFSESGDEPDVDRFLSGEHECMVSYTAEECAAAGKIYRIEVNPSASATFTSNELIMRGLVVLGIYNKIVDAGGNCEIFLRWQVTSKTNDAGALLTITAPICSPDRPLSGERVAFILCNADFMRRILIRIRESHFSDATRKQFGVGNYYTGNNGCFPSGFKSLAASDGVFQVGSMTAYSNGTKDKWPQTPEEAAQTADKLLSDGLIDNHSTTQAA